VRADVEGHLLERVRKQIGPKIPLVATLDLHANLTRRMVESADVLTLYHTAPQHRRQGTGKRRRRGHCGECCRRGKPVAAFRKLPMVVPAERAITQNPESFSYGVRKTLEGWERNHHVLSAGLATCSRARHPGSRQRGAGRCGRRAWKPWADEACANLANDVWMHRRDYCRS